MFKYFTIYAIIMTIKLNIKKQLLTIYTKFPRLNINLAYTVFALLHKRIVTVY